MFAHVDSIHSRCHCSCNVAETFSPSWKTKSSSVYVSIYSCFRCPLVPLCILSLSQNQNRPYGTGYSGRHWTVEYVFTGHYPYLLQCVLASWLASRDVSYTTDFFCSNGQEFVPYICLIVCIPIPLGNVLSSSSRCHPLDFGGRSSHGCYGDKILLERIHTRSNRQRISRSAMVFNTTSLEEKKQ